MLTNLKTRFDRLLRLGRLLLPDAVSRVDQPLAVVIGLVVLFFAIACLAAFFLLPLLFGIEDDALRRNLLNLIACAVAVLWLIAQVVLRAPVVWLVDLEPLLPLPVGFGDLYRLRLALSIFGYWLVGLGPAAVYLVVARSGDSGGFLVGLLGMLVLVWTLGRVGAILSLKVDHLVEGVLGSLALLLVVVALYSGIAFAIGVVVAGIDVGAVRTVDFVATTIRESPLLVAIGYTPPGLLVGIFDAPGWTGANLLRVGGLLAVLRALVVLERRMLLSSYLDRPGGPRRTAGKVLPLATILRKAPRLSGSGCLLLLEAECTLRLKPARWSVVICLGFGLCYSLALFTPAFLGLGGVSSELIILALPFTVLLAVASLQSVRTEKPPNSCHVWRESLAFPITTLHVFRTPGKVPNALAVAFVLMITAAVLARFGSPDWLAVCVGVCLALSIVVLADAGYSLVQLNWPQRRAGTKRAVDPRRLIVCFLLPLPVSTPILIAVILFRVYDEHSDGPLIAAAVAAGVLLLAAAIGLGSRIWQQRVIEGKGAQYLVRDYP